MSSFERLVIDQMQHGVPEPSPAPWQLSEFGAAVEAEESPEEEVEAIPVKSEAEWEQEVEAAYEGGLAAGRAQGHAEGFAEGRAEGLHEGRKEEAERLSTVLLALEEALHQVKHAAEHRPDVLAANLSALAIAIARQIIGRELRGDPGAITDMVRRALVEFPIDQPLRIRLNPHDLSTITALSKPHGDVVTIAPGRDLRWLADPLLEPGSCVVEGKERLVDGRIDHALERVYRRLIRD